MKSKFVLKTKNRLIRSVHSGIWIFVWLSLDWMLCAELVPLIIKENGNVGIHVDDNESLNDEFHIKASTTIDGILTLTPKQNFPQQPKNGSIVLHSDGYLYMYVTDEWKALAFKTGYQDGGSQGSEGWTPELIGTEIWFDASDAESLNHEYGKLSMWKDKSGKERHAVQYSEERQPSVSSDKVTFDGYDWLTFSEYQKHQPMLYAVVRNHSQNLINYFIGSNTEGGYFSAGTHAKQSLYFNAYGVATEGGQGVTLTEPYYNHELNLVAISSEYISVNGILKNLQQSDAATVKLNVLGGRAFTHLALNFSGDIHEIIVLSETSNQQEREVIEGYLAHKWDLLGKLPDDHPYKISMP